ncbi:MAG TPA: ISAs1 family transposase, partial [Oscillatoriaceae cyanobacterium M33_DOE_052]|nr:ISAs1 family transposase [Oscillatoriaceae cyanobacterium M33_DOE_052]
MSDSAWLSSSLHHHFGLIDDPRVPGRCAHRLVDIIMIALLAVLAGATGGEEIATYGQGKQTWLSTFLELPNGIPSHDTFRRVLAQLDPAELEARFQDWMGSLLDQLGGTLIAIDGKTVKGSYDRQNQIKALQMVSAWSTTHGGG